MSAMIRTKIEAPDNAALRCSIYDGDIYVLGASPASLKLVARVVALLAAEFSEHASVDLRQLQFHIAADELYQRIGKVRKAMLADAELTALLGALLQEQGFAPEEHGIDPTRLRAVSHKGHENPLAAPAYFAHRDTWYANTEAQVNWWIPLFDVVAGETFTFFPAYFYTAVENNSAAFDYESWMAKVGWQNTSGVAAVYPSADDFDRSAALPFACKAGDIVLFSASHLHQTNKNECGATRFSVDFRTVHLTDHESGLGAPNVDNLSTGSESALQDYLRKDDLQK
jgi:hypothetical protein